MEWLKKLRGPKFYRYFFYRQYVLSKKWGNIQPAFSSMLVIALTGFFHFFFILFALAALFHIDIFGSYFVNAHPLLIVLFLLLFLSVYYFLFYYKGKWQDILKEFKGESEKQRNLGKYYLYLYLFISLILLFRATLSFIQVTSPYIGK